MGILTTNSEIIKEIERTPDEEIMFILLAGTTEISSIPGLSAAGVTPEITRLTPAVDAEILMSGRCKSMDEPPMTPEGIPTPAVVTKGALNLTGVRPMVIDSGFALYPGVPFIYSGTGASGDPRKGASLKNFDTAYHTGKYVANLLNGKYRMTFLAESVPGGTTTAMMVLRARGFELQTSSSMPDDPVDLKENLWREAFMMRRNVKPGFMEAVRQYGDYTMVTALGFLSSYRGITILSGGTQMANIFSLFSQYSIENDINRELYLATTSYIYDHRPDTIKKLIPENRIIVSEISMSESRYDGLKAYDHGHVREGVGMGGAYLLSYLRTQSDSKIHKSVDDLYQTLM